MNRDKYVQIPISRETRLLLKGFIKTLKDKSDKFIGYDEAIDELVRNIRENDEFINQQMRLLERNALQLKYKEVVKKKQLGR